MGCFQRADYTLIPRREEIREERAARIEKEYGKGERGNKVFYGKDMGAIHPRIGL
jgi:hypothetical protein